MYEDGITFIRRNGDRLKISATPLRQMHAERQLTDDALESGGILLGRYIRDCCDVVVDEVTLPMPGDKRYLRAIERSDEGHQQVINDRWAQSNGTCNYLGEWHTHAEPVPTPSQIDINDWVRHTTNDIYDADGLFWVIVGQKETKAWFCDKLTGKLEELSLS